MVDGPWRYTDRRTDREHVHIAPEKLPSRRAQPLSKTRHVRLLPWQEVQPLVLALLLVMPAAG